MKLYMAAAFPLAAAALLAQPPQNAGTQWFRDAKFGLSIRWGLFSIPAGEWKGQTIPGPPESIMRNAGIPLQEYERLASQFNPTYFDAEAWVKFAEDCGARYIVFDAKDRDGFAMYRSNVSKFNVTGLTPFKRDPLKELTEACARHHMRVGVYYSHAEDWHEDHFARYLSAKAEPQLKELLTGYGPLSLVQFDAPNPRLAALVHSLQPAALVDIGSTASVNNSAAFKKGDNAWKTPEALTFGLVDAVSRDGNYLLNLGPTAEGIIPSPAMANLLPVGRWLKVNGEAIFGAGPTAFGFGFASPSTRWRCTTKPGKLFIHLFEWPRGFMDLSNVRVSVAKVYFLADASRSPLPFTQQGDRVRIPLPEHPPAEQELSPRLIPKLAHLNELEHVRVVLALETRGN